MQSVIQAAESASTGPRRGESEANLSAPKSSRSTTRSTTRERRCAQLSAATDVAVVEACYLEAVDHATWADGLLESLTRAHGSVAGLALIRELGDTRRTEFCRAPDFSHDAVLAVQAMTENLPHAQYRALYYPQRKVLLASSVVRRSRMLRPVLERLLANTGLSDVIGILGYPAPGWAFSMFLASREQNLAPDAATRARLHRLRIHVESALRLRMFAPASPSAIILPSGRLDDVAPELKDGEPVRRLAEQAQRLEALRGRAEDSGALTTWSALVEGSWSLVEHVEPGGPRCYHAYENAPHVRSERALTELEAVAVELLTRGQSGKEIAYATGISESRASRLLASAAARLGFGTRADLMRGLGLLRTQGAPEVLTDSLTNSEREVLAHVRAGLRNAEIAVLRATSIHTVANQVASILRKTGARSRRTLMTAGPT